MASGLDYFWSISVGCVGYHATGEIVRETAEQLISRLLGQERGEAQDDLARALQQVQREPANTVAVQVMENYRGKLEFTNYAIEKWKQIRALESVIRICST
jgi:hypothetical protein